MKNAIDGVGTSTRRKMGHLINMVAVTTKRVLERAEIYARDFVSSELCIYQF
jgi:hypothetical protein